MHSRGEGLSANQSVRNQQSNNKLSTMVVNNITLHSFYEQNTVDRLARGNALIDSIRPAGSKGCRPLL